MNFSLFTSLLLAADANRYRIINYDFPPLLKDSLNVSTFTLILLGLIIGSFVLGYLFERATRLKEYGWKVGLILATALASTFVVLFGDFRLGVDLKGGVILVYEVDQAQTKAMSRKGKSEWSMDQLLGVLRRRLNPDGLKEIVVRPFGSQQVEIVVPEVDPVEVAKIKENIATAGVLQFMIVAAADTDAELVQWARNRAEKLGAERLSREVLDDQGGKAGYWATLAREDKLEGQTGDPPWRSLDLINGTILRGKESGEILDISPTERQSFFQNPLAFQAYLQERGARDVDVLLKYDPDFDIRGDDLANSYNSFDPGTGPCIAFSMTTDGSFKMGYLTQNNLQRRLAIVFDNSLLSAPVIQSKIQEQGQITGRFTQEEIDFIVGILKSGSMPVVMMKQPTSQNQIGAILGRDTIEQGSRSVVVALGLILVFMAIYYRFAGLVASFALALNLTLTVALMVLLQAPVTLPGLAGLVLTVAMSVDANVLISERMKEELAKGATLRMGIRNGFDKALSAIIDGNITTFLTALVLYAIGTDQVRGFGITLMLGNVTSVFTAIFCARVILEICERMRWIKTLRMTSFLTNPQIDWVRFFRPAVALSGILILIGLIATVARGRGLFDIDLAGGTSVTGILKKPLPEDEVRKKLATVFKGMVDPDTKTTVDYNVYQFRVETLPQGSVYKVDSSLSSIEMLEEKIREALRADDGSDALKTYQMEFGQLAELSTETAPPSISAPPPTTTGLPGFGPSLMPPATTTPGPTTPAPAIPPPTETPPAKAGEKAAEPPPAEKATEKAAEPPAKAPADKGVEKAPEKAAEPPAEKSPECENSQEQEKTADVAKSAEAAKDEQSKADAGKAESGKAETTKTEQEKSEPGKAKPAETETPPAAADKTEPPTADAGKAAPSASIGPTLPGTLVPAPAAARPKTKVAANLRFPGTPLSGFAVRDRIVSSSKATLGREVESLPKDWDGSDNALRDNWNVEIIGVTQPQAEKLLTHMESTLEKEVMWQTSSKIGGQVSADTRWRALGALAVSLLGIIAYVWFRFQRVAWGLAAVAALAHDALVMLTAIALSYWCVGFLGFLGVEEFKISLAVVAAFLAILGYSVNDTIVIFDRLREIRGKSPEVTRQMLNDAVNQTLGRNIILAGITVTVVTILYAFGGPGIHAFAFAMMAGVISGCYTTLVIAAPLLLWLLNKSAIQGDSGLAKRDAA